MDDLRFAAPWALWLLAVIPPIAWLAFPRRGSGSVRMGSLASAAGLPRTWRVRLEPGLILLRIAAIALLVVAVARPQQGEAASEAQGEGIDIVLAFDVSASMTQPFGQGRTRLDAAKDVLSRFIGGRTNDRVALVAFQGSTITLSPLTDDYAAVDESVQGADQVRLADGTAIGTAIGESVNVLRGSSAVSRIVILMTDGESNAGEIAPLAAARIAERLGARVYTIGVVSRIGMSQQSSLNVDERSLQEIADVTGATYNRAEDPAALAQIYQRIDELEKSRFEAQAFTRYDDIAPYFLAAAGALFALEFVLRCTAFRRLV
ncbi:MAG: VWA domain-containing protein [Dehalococcoidia bacterium]